MRIAVSAVGTAAAHEEGRRFGGERGVLLQVRYLDVVRNCDRLSKTSGRPARDDCANRGAKPLAQKETDEELTVCGERDFPILFKLFLAQDILNLIGGTYRRSLAVGAGSIRTAESRTRADSA